MNGTSPKKSDLGVRVASAIVMVAVAGTALWLGGWVWTAFVSLVALGVLWEWRGLVRGFASNLTSLIFWSIGGLIYVGLAAVTLINLRQEPGSGWMLLLIVLFAVIGTDVGAYFAGRAFGGPKIAPMISPSKTWAGLVGGATAASVVIFFVVGFWHSGLCEILVPSFIDPAGNRSQFDGPCSLGLPSLRYHLASSVLAGTVVAMVAQTGDFFESWMKRRAGVKDSGKLIPGHGGLLDRTDGFIAVLFVLGSISLYEFVTSL